MDNNEYINEIIRRNWLKKEEILDNYIMENNNNQFRINLQNILLVINLLIYIIYFVLGLIIMLNSDEVINITDNSLNYFYNTSSIKITQDNLYIGFSLEDLETYDNFIDETIYYPKAYFKTGKRFGHRWK